MDSSSDEVAWITDRRVCEWFLVGERTHSVVPRRLADGFKASARVSRRPVGGEASSVRP
jgi:hypothetical protein